MEEEDLAAGTCRASESHHDVREDVQKLVGGIGHWSEELLFQELVTQLLLSKHLQGNARLGSGELVQLRKLFQETRTRFKLLDVQVEVKDLEAEMRDLKVQGTEGGAQSKEWNGRMRYSETSEYLQFARRTSLIPEDAGDVVGADLETKMQLGEMELEHEDRLEDAESQKHSGKRRTCFGVAISKFDVKKSRHDLPSFTKQN